MRHLRPVAAGALALVLTLAPLAALAGLAPSFLLKTINPARGIPARISLAEYVGPDALEETTAMVVYFCSQSDPGWEGDLEFLAYAFNKLNKKGMRAVAVLMDEGKPAANKAKAAARSARAKFPLAQDRKRKVAKRYGVTKAPGIFVINSDGYITFNAVAFREDLDEFLMSAVKDTMRGRQVDVSVGGGPVAMAPPPPPPPAPGPDYADEPLPEGDAGAPADAPLGREVTPAPSAPPPPPPAAPAPEPEPAPAPPPPPPAPRETPEEKQLKLYMPLEAGNQWEFFHRPKAGGDWHERIVLDITAGAFRDFTVAMTVTRYPTPSPETKRSKETWKLSPDGIAIGKGRYLLRTPIRPGTPVGPRAGGDGSLKVADVGAKTRWSGRRLNRCVEVASGGASDATRDRYLFCPGVGLVEFTLYSKKLERQRTFDLVRYQVGGKRMEIRGYNEVLEPQVIREVRNGERAKKILAAGRKLMDQNEYEKAMEEFAAIEELFPKRGYMDSSYWLGVAYLKVGLRKNNSGLVKKAAAALQIAVDEDPDNDEGHFWLGNAYLLMGNQKAAKAAWRKVDAPAETRKAARRALRNPRQAYDDLKPLALVEEAHEHRKKGNLDDALGLYQAIIKEYPKNEEAHLGLGLVYYNQNDLKASLAEFQTVLEINDDNRLAMNYVNLVRMKLSR